MLSLSHKNHIITEKSINVKILGIILLSILAAILLFILFLWIVSLPIDKTKSYDKDSKFYRGLLYFCTSLAMFFLRVKINVTGAEQIPKSSYLFVGNHRSNFDPLIAWHIFEESNLAFISKPDNFDVPIFGKYVKRCCFMGIDRSSPRQSMTVINAAADLIRCGEVSVGVYPEGTRSFDGKLLPFHNGVLKTAIKAKCPIVVVGMEGTEKIHENTPFRRSVVDVKVIKVINPDGRTTQELGDMVKDCLKPYDKSVSAKA